ncbi:hypothetical protein GDO81_006338 [Engystomops pustulosus]|uniref:Uncharacterized protein n=1 Tax=Engystomops pustulosus TaxID=76066 RepID=A0AAV7CY14_ENGPU|nr:hypothetical protein GDO81_006338 [Engystomops pustulosus]
MCSFPVHHSGGDFFTTTRHKVTAQSPGTWLIGFDEFRLVSRQRHGRAVF